jgi:hypothetical protein
VDGEWLAALQIEGSKPITYASVSTPDSGKCGAVSSSHHVRMRDASERVDFLHQRRHFNTTSHPNPPTTYPQHGRTSHHSRCHQVSIPLRVYAPVLICYRSIFEPSGCFVEQPVLQCVQIKTMEPKAGDANPVQRFRVVLSDIRNFIQTMIATSMSSVTDVCESADLL